MDVINLSGTDASGIEDQNVIPPPASDLIYELKSKKSKTLVHFFSVLTDFFSSKEYTKIYQSYILILQFILNC